jgi:hypothetical protein
MQFNNTFLRYSYHNGSDCEKIKNKKGKQNKISSGILIFKITRDLFCTFVIDY